MNETPSLSSFGTQLRAALRDRQAARNARRSLQRDLATYSTEAQISEMEAILARYEDTADVVALRTIVQQARTAA
jgi:hypothetical protein